MDMRLPTNGCDLRKAVQAARQLGVAVTPHHGGELLLWHPGSGRRVVVSASRKDSSRAVTTFLKRVYAAVVASRAANARLSRPSETI